MKQINQKLNIAIIGQGRFGKLMTEILKPFGSLFIISSRKVKIKNVKQIAHKNLIDMDWIIPCVPISALRSVLKTIKPFLKKGSLVMDVCSVKIWPAKWMKRILPKDIEILCAHPMFGPDSVKAGLNGLQIVVCPVRISKKTLNKILKIFNKLNLQIIKTTPIEHDKQAAISLALVHFIGRGLAKLDIKNQKINTLGFKRLLAVNETVNNDTWELFLDMHKYNPYTKKIRKNFIKSLNNLDKEINKKKGGKK